MGDIKLTWETVLTKFQDLIKFAARQQLRNRSVDPSVSFEDLNQEGMIKLHECWSIWCVDPVRNKDMDEFGPIFRTSLFRRMKQVGGRKIVHTDIEDAANTIEDTNSVDVIEQMSRNISMQILRDALYSDISRNLLQELIQPSNRTLFEVWADIKRKEMIKSQGYKVNVPKDHTVRMKHIIRSLSITNKQYDLAMADIREKAKLLLER